jgi:peptidoglycan hydrolase-like protein with peptidoglycan-binding domain
LLADVNKFAPHRRKDSDGSIGDARHQAERTSDHNPYIVLNGVGIVRARDFTHAPETGFDAYAFAEMLRINKDDRIRYIISNKKIASGAGGPSPWVWRPYTGSNPHDHHTHVSATEDAKHFDDPREWTFKGMDAAVVEQAPVANNFVVPPATLRVGARGDLVKKMQAGIGLTGKAVDGFFGADETLPALKKFQLANKLDSDGICGPSTWKLITAA